MADKESFGLKGRTVVVTGAGGGLGREHALLFAKYGANVVVNDLGGKPDGTGKSTSMADHVVDEIKAAGGKAVANYDSVSDKAGSESMIKSAVDAFGSIDILINNAGILRDKSFSNMDESDWDAVMAVHVKGAYYCTRAAWPRMREQKFGRIVMTSSASGIYGNFGQSNYSAAKNALIGLGQTLALEGEKYNVRTNIIAPVALSRMTQDLMPAFVHDFIKPEYVSPLVVFLCSEKCDENGQIYEVGAGAFCRIETIRSIGYRVKPAGEITVDQVADHWKEINDMGEDSQKLSHAEILRSIGESTQSTMKHCMS